MTISEVKAKNILIACKNATTGETGFIRLDEIAKRIFETIKETENNNVS